MAKQGILLVVDDNRNILTSLQYLLGEYFERVITIDSPVTIPTLLNREAVDIVLLDMNFSSGINSGNEGLYWLREIKRLRPQTEVVLFTAYADINLAVTGIKEGAADFVVKPWENARLVQTLQEAYSRIVEARKGKKKTAVAPVASDAGMYWGNSQAIRPLRMLVEKVSTTDANILITGENGTGKDMLAREIHRLSNRKEGPMIAVDMGAITESLFESELFGHVKGSFTGALNDKAGAFEEANGGTLFLDEIGNLSYEVQVQLLRALQERRIRRIGSTKEIEVDVRLISATNENLKEAIAKGNFREDLYHRINEFTLQMPSLKERPEDILLFANFFLDQANHELERTLIGFDAEASEAMQKYPWPGNLRQLKNVVKRATLLAQGEFITAKDLGEEINERKTVCENPEMEETFALHDEETEKHRILKALQQTGNNKTKAATLLGIDRKTLYNKLKLYHIPQ